MLKLAHLFRHLQLIPTHPLVIHCTAGKNVKCETAV